MRVKRPGWIIIPAVLLLGLFVWLSMGLSFTKLLQGWFNAVEFFRDELPPDWSVLNIAYRGALETLQIAYLGTLFGVALSLPLSVLASRNLLPPFITTPVRLVLAAVRVLPSLLWAVLFVIIVGLGPLAGVLATTLYSIGYLGKLQYEAFEGLPSDGLDVARATGATRLQLARWVVLPESGNILLSQALFMFEYNVRASTILGLVGAGGIGFYINRFLSVQEYSRVFALLFVIFVLVVAIDWISIRVRRRFLDDSERRRPLWREAVKGALGLDRMRRSP
jgi:phosphonate transport system permease protein